MQKLHPSSLWLFFLRNALIAVGIACVLGFGVILTLILTEDPSATNSAEVIIKLFLIGAVVIFLVTMLGAIVAYIWAKWQYRFYQYELREDGFRKEYGVIAKRYVTIPYERIQNIDIYRRLVERILGLSTLKIQTAGGSSVSIGAEGILLGLSYEVAEQMRDELVKRSKNKKTRNDGV